LRILLRRLESPSWNSFNSFPIVNEVSAGVSKPCISSLLTESAGATKSKLFPQFYRQLFFNWMTLNSGDMHNLTRKVAVMSLEGRERSLKTKNASRENKTKQYDA
jgi:hypothetical protein